MDAIPNLDAAWAVQLAQFCAEAYREQAGHIDAAPSAAGQVDYVLAAEYALDTSLVRYALGGRLDEVTGWLVRAARAYFELFHSGSAPVLPMLAVKDQALGSSSARTDDSLTNPQRALLAMYVALVASDLGLAKAIARCVREDSSAAATAESQVARALRLLLLGNSVPDFEFRGRNDFSETLRHQAIAMQAIARHEQEAFLQAHAAVLALHELEAAEAENAREPRRFLCLPALGLGVIAIGRKLTTGEELKGGCCASFPLSLLPRSPGFGELDRVDC